ncbi:glycosyltransferase [Methyloceanibacter sp.]|uniref:glycosyltransferase n=1 Tax=Methyloceanibacter sp. TaxID=1965321 RepID=UPI003D6D7036
MFSLIVCTVDRTTPLERLLRSLALQSDRAFEIVLVDQNQDDRLQALVESFGKIMPIVHVKAARGLSLARNKGLSVARGDFIAFPDDDCHYPRTLIEQVRKRFACVPDIDVLTGRTTDTDGKDSLGTFLEQDSQIDRWNVWRCGNSNTVFVRRSVIAAGLRFNEELGVGAASPFQSGEETAFLLDAMAKGSRGRFYRDIVVYHDQVGETDALRARKYARGFGRILALYDYPTAYLARSLVRPALRAALGLASLNLRLARYKMLWALGVYEGYTGKL